MLDIAVAPTWSAMAFDCSMTAFTAATLASIGPLPARIWLILLIAGLCDLGQPIPQIVHRIGDLLALVAFDLALMRDGG
ncbi:Uncharacterised protein [Mycobacterium tuberculosis]|nr:Uncharacterised protein [Mycobacterium tuberculosis]